MKGLRTAIAMAMLAIAITSQTALAADTSTPASQATPPPAAAPAAAPAPTPSPTPPSALAKKIVVSLSQEKIFAYENGNLVGQSIVTTGGPWTRTPIGTFSVIEKRTNWNMTSPWPEDDWRWYAPSWVNYGLLFEASGFFMHDAPWRHNFGPGSNAQTGTPGGDFTGTHGCVNVPLQFERDLFNWAAIGTPVVVQP